jgi:hypothetical protein
LPPGTVLLSAPGAEPVFTFARMPKLDKILGKARSRPPVPPAIPSTATAIASTVGIDRRKLLQVQKQLVDLGIIKPLARRST